MSLQTPGAAVKAAAGGHLTGSSVTSVSIPFFSSSGLKEFQVFVRDTGKTMSYNLCQHHCAVSCSNMQGAFHIWGYAEWQRNKQPSLEREGKLLGGGDNEMSLE